jgi:hypothetical protein
MSAERVKNLISTGDLQTLYENDQVRRGSSYTLCNLIPIVEHTNGRGFDLPSLLRVKNHFHANI